MSPENPLALGENANCTAHIGSLTAQFAQGKSYTVFTVVVENKRLIFPPAPRLVGWQGLVIRCFHAML